MTRPRPGRTLVPLLLACTLLADASAGQTFGPPHTVPGDGLVGLAPQVQAVPAIAAGGPGYLAVWEDSRANLAGALSSPGALSAGNGVDLVGAVLDPAGEVLVGPFVVANQGMDQTEPRIAWNGSHWLVVFVSQRPDWYFFDDVLAVRVAPDGSVLDDEPIVVRPENNSPANDLGTNPCVASDGTNWLVAWKAIDWDTSKIILEGTRIAPSGALLDPDYVTLYTHTDFVFGPDFPEVASAGGNWLLVWDDFGEVRGRLYAGDLTPLGPASILAQPAEWPHVASNGSEYLVVAGLRAYRVAGDGTLLDPGGIPLPEASSNLSSHPDVAWNGASWSVTYAESATGSIFDDLDAWLVRVATDGSVLDPAPILAAGSARSESAPVVAGGAGASLVLQQATTGGGAQDDVLASRVLADGTVEPPIEIGTGLARQEHVHWVKGDGVHLAVYVSRSSGKARILSQRFDLSGEPIDLVPTLVHQGTEFTSYAPGAAWNGEVFLVTWRESNGLVLGRRLSADNQVLGFGNILIFDISSGRPTVDALQGDFLVASTYQVSGDLSYLQGIRVDGATGFPIEAEPFDIGFDYALTPEITTVGDRWLVAWDSRPCHDCGGSTVFGRWYEFDGTPSGSFILNGPGYGGSPDVAVAGDRALVTWSDASNFGGDAIEGRLLAPDGTFLGGEFLIADGPNRQVTPSADFDGGRFVVAWADYRSIQGVEQNRADVWAARVALDGTVLDPGGFQVTDTVLPEDEPEIVASAGTTVLSYLALDGVGGVPLVQRLHLRTLEDGWVCQEDLGFGGPGTATLSVCGDPLASGGVAHLALQQAPAGAPALVVYSSTLNPVPVVGGTLAAFPPLGAVGLLTDAFGEAWLEGVQGGNGPLDLFVQGVVVDPAQAFGFQLTNALRLEYLP